MKKDPKNFQKICLISKNGFDINKVPCWPCLLYSRQTQKKNSNRQFYACSTFRDRKLCRTFHWKDEFEKKMKNDNFQDKMIFLNAIQAEQNEIQLKMDKNVQNLRKKENASLASFMFNRETVEFISDSILSMGYNGVICIGTPTVYYEGLEKYPDVDFIFMDIDENKNPELHGKTAKNPFIQYNVFNNHFYKSSDKEIIQNFIKKHKKMAIFIDPPFGGLIEPWTWSINNFLEDHRKLHKSKNRLHLYAFLPYFLKRWLSKFQQVNMMDYRVTYEKNRFNRFHKNSAVRIMTNANLKLFKCSQPEYRICEICKIVVHKNNIHCKSCGKCVIIHNEKRQHCSKCSRCVNSLNAFTHCDNCNACVNKTHNCGKSEMGCKNCKKGECEMRRDCPTKRRKIKMAKCVSKE
ncbi:Zinc finger CCHC domain-containing protein 4 [Intoshia linei]|uniref:Zinc finger CCHC domain-containing protein 4 n=1 Tax=Intoshia linei TaxID=1819745 RepID=A0A177BDS4_9BILA|nr:Zinc finger CCHC domain-containing protein 4 [Intoshia linei]